MPTVKKTSTPRARKLRERRAKLGIVRLELYAHHADHAAIKRFAAQLQRKREKPKP